MIWKVNLWEGEVEAGLDWKIQSVPSESFQAAGPIHAGLQREGLMGQAGALDLL